MEIAQEFRVGLRQVQRVCRTPVGEAGVRVAQPALGLEVDVKGRPVGRREDADDHARQRGHKVQRVESAATAHSVPGLSAVNHQLNPTYTKIKVNASPRQSTNNDWGK